jgi:2-polyprenyl-3-methyl-5-hydroxy-6-metoxy-1,4-benzoquinol methylase
MKCRFCNTELENVFIDLVNSPPSNSFLTKEQLQEPEVFYPLKTYTCKKCMLVQVDEFKKAEDIFNSDYVYFSSFSTSWLAHSRRYTELMANRFGIKEDSLVIEVASNDGYLLQYFKEKNIPVLGIEPTLSTANEARKKGIETIVDFFGIRLAELLKEENRQADLILGNNVLAHVPDLNDFVGGLKILLKENGIVTMEFPHILQLIQNNQFDTIYHEHFSYFSLITVKQVFEKHGLAVFDVEELPTHGGSLRIYAKHGSDNSKQLSPSIETLLAKEKQFNLHSPAGYANFQVKVEDLKYQLLNFLLDEKKKGKKIAAYGAAAKGNTMLNYFGIKNDLIEFVVDKSPFKQGKYLPGSHIPVVTEDEIRKAKPDYILIFPWNIKEEITEQLNYVREWDCKFVVAIPSLNIY